MRAPIAVLALLALSSGALAEDAPAVVAPPAAARWAASRSAGTVMARSSRRSSGHCRSNAALKRSQAAASIALARPAARHMSTAAAG